MITLYNSNCKVIALCDSESPVHSEINSCLEGRHSKRVWRVWPLAANDPSRTPCALIQWSKMLYVEVNLLFQKYLNWLRTNQWWAHLSIELIQRMFIGHWVLCIDLLIYCQNIQYWSFHTPKYQWSLHSILFQILLQLLKSYNSLSKYSNYFDFIDIEI